MSTLTYREAGKKDLDLLAEWNRQLKEDEGHREAMTIPELHKRMKEWIRKEYRALIFTHEGRDVGYALFAESKEQIYLRQLFIARDSRCKGIGREAVALMRSKVWPSNKLLLVSTLATNRRAENFYLAAGFSEYCTTFEIRPNTP